jgi:hypothetical protein
MDVPRSWWERALKTGYADDTHASILCEFLAELSNLGKVVSSELLVALAFAEFSLNTTNSQTSIEDYLIKAEMVLAKRPDLAKLGKLIDEKQPAAPAD